MRIRLLGRRLGLRRLRRAVFGDDVGERRVGARLVAHENNRAGAVRQRVETGAHDWIGAVVARIARGGNACLLQGFLQGVGRLPQIVRAVRRGEDEDGVGISAVRQGNVNEAVRAGGDVSERMRTTRMRMGFLKIIWQIFSFCRMVLLILFVL